MASVQFVSNVGSWIQTVGAQELFLVNAASFVPVIGAVARWRGRTRPASASSEHGSALPG
jgi:hypothetical protein